MICRQRRSWAWFCLKWTEQTGLQALYHLTPAAALSLGNISGLMVMVWGPGIHFSPRLQASGTWLQVRDFGFHSCCAFNVLWKLLQTLVSLESECASSADIRDHSARPLKPRKKLRHERGVTCV